MLKERFSPEDLREVISQVEYLKQDGSVAWVYRNDGFEDLEVREMASRVYEYLLK
jgi:hypothetical protein